jgi:hypothetical protein
MLQEMQQNSTLEKKEGEGDEKEEFVIDTRIEGDTDYFVLMLFYFYKQTFILF